MPRRLVPFPRRPRLSSCGRLIVAAGLVAAAVAGVAAGPAAAAPAEPLPVLPHVVFYPTGTMNPSAHPVPLGRAGGHVTASYRYAGSVRTFDDYLRRTSARALVVVHDGRLVDERYWNGYSSASRFNSWSVGKSITSTAVGIAVGDGTISSLDDPITTYLPELRGSGYDGVPIKHILQMSSGQNYDESDYSNVTAGATGTTIRLVLGEPLIHQAQQSVRVRPSGTKFNYASMDTYVLGRLVTRVTGRPLADFVQDRIWRPAGMASPALVGHDYYGSAIAYASYHATTRDFARFGLLFQQHGRVGGRQVVPGDWVDVATRATSAQVRPGRLYPGAPYGYGYQWWVGGPENGRASRGDFVAVGILGQYVYVSPRDNVVIAQNSEDLQADTNMDEALSAFRAVADVLARR
ncbi:MAG: serine hydrolase [Gordonia sp. (in: high G+C Gram-positive bacteria)]